MNPGSAHLRNYFTRIILHLSITHTEVVKKSSHFVPILQLYYDAPFQLKP